MLCMGCKKNTQTNATNDKPIITVSILPLKYITEQVTGDAFQINTMVPKGMSPESYEPTAKQMVDLTRSVIYIKVGHIAFEQTWLPKITEDHKKLHILDASQNIKLQTSSAQIIDPHIWMSCENAIQIAKNIYQYIITIDPDNKNTYQENLNKFIRIAEKTDQEIKKNIGQSVSKAFLIYHPALTYFARDYGLTQIPIEEEGHQPSAKSIKQVVTKAKELKAKKLFIQKENHNDNIISVAEETNTEINEIHPLNDQWDQEMIEISLKLK